MREADIIIIGAGMVGSAIAFGLARKGLRVIALDGVDRDYRAAKANGGLIWVQSKGANMPPYRVWTYRSAELWPGFAGELATVSGLDVHFRQEGGIAFCLSSEEFESRARRLSPILDNEAEDGHGIEMIDRRQSESLFPGLELGPDIVGGSYSRLDGRVDPLRLLCAMQTSFRRLGGELVGGFPAVSITPTDGGYAVAGRTAAFRAEKVVIAAGMGAPALVAPLGIDIAIRPQKGQTLITERVAPVMALPALDIWQLEDGGFLIGTTREEAGFDTTATARAGIEMARRAVRILPALARLTVLRQWAGLRVMTPDSAPIYIQPAEFPGLFIAACHSGVTLAAAHAGDLADAVAEGALPRTLAPFDQRRFDVPEAA